MTQKKTVSAELRKLFDGGKLILGNDRTLKRLRKGELSKVFVASNCAEHAKETVRYYAELGKVPFEELGIDDSEIGVVCKKQFSIAVFGVLKSK